MSKHTIPPKEAADGATVPLRDARPGDHILIRAMVMDRPGRGNVRVLIAGVGEGGTWALPNSAEVTIIGRYDQ